MEMEAALADFQTISLSLSRNRIHTNIALLKWYCVQLHCKWCIVSGLSILRKHWCFRLDYEPVNDGYFPVIAA